MARHPIHDCVFDAQDGTLKGPQGQRVGLRPKVAALLEALLQSPGEVVRKDTLIEHIWSEGVVDFEAGLAALLKELRGAFVQAGSSQDPATVIETLPKRGVRLNLPITDHATSDAAPSVASGASAVDTTIDRTIDAPIDAPVEAPIDTRPNLSWKRIAAPMLSLALMALVAWVLLSHDWQSQSPTPADGPQHTLAILPFEVYGGVPERASAEGLLAADTLLSGLWSEALPDTALLGRVSLAPYPDETARSLVAALARDLGVSLIVEGRLVWTENGGSMNVRLVSTSNFQVLMSETIELSSTQPGAPTDRSARIGQASEALAARLAQHFHQ